MESGGSKRGGGLYNWHPVVYDLPDWSEIQSSQLSVYMNDSVFTQRTCTIKQQKENVHTPHMSKPLHTEILFLFEKEIRIKIRIR